MRYFLLLLYPFLLGMGEKPKYPESVPYVYPPGLQQFILDHVPGFSLPGLKDFSPELKEHYYKFRDFHYHPAVTMGDFNKDGLEDIAMRLIREDGKVALVAFPRVTDKTFNAVVLSRENTLGDRFIEFDGRQILDSDMFGNSRLFVFDLVERRYKELK